MRRNDLEHGFTLIELSIVLVIIGLIVGGVLVGRDLISAAQVRAQITQIERYNTAANAFRGKFGYLPGDIPLATAGALGLWTGSCTGGKGQRDGDGLLGLATNSSQENLSLGSAVFQGAGEVGLFWQDLSSSVGGNLIDGVYSGIDCSLPITNTASPNITNYMPAAKLGQSQYIYIYSSNGYNWYGTAYASGMDTVGNLLNSGAFTNLLVSQAYAIDTKMDDGLPSTGAVVAQYYAVWGGATTSLANATSHNPPNSNFCIDKSVTPFVYNMSTAANNPNCPLNFRFQ